MLVRDNTPKDSEGLKIVSWREVAQDCIEVGKQLQIIAEAFRDIRATGVVSESLARQRLDSATSAARRLARLLDGMRR